MKGDLSPPDLGMRKVKSRGPDSNENKNKLELGSKHSSDKKKSGEAQRNEDQAIVSNS